jgi:hypothetical protein
MGYNTIKLYHCSSIEEDRGDTVRRTLCGKLTVSHESWDWPMDFAQSTLSPAFGYDKCEECENHPDLPMALLGDVDDE